MSFTSKDRAGAWLGGIIDGEGSVSKRRDQRQVVIVNTDILLLDGVRDACQTLGIEPREYERSERARRGSKRIWEIHISRRKDIERLAEYVVLRGEKAARFVTMFESYPPLPPIEECKQLHAQGITQREIAQTLGVPQSTVQMWLAMAGLAKTVPGPPDDELAAAYAELGSVKGIGERYGVSQATAARWVKIAGLARAPGRPRGRGWSVEERERRAIGGGG